MRYKIYSEIAHVYIDKQDLSKGLEYLDMISYKSDYLSSYIEIVRRYIFNNELKLAVDILLSRPIFKDQRAFYLECATACCKRGQFAEAIKLIQTLQLTSEESDCFAKLFVDDHNKAIKTFTRV